MPCTAKETIQQIVEQHNDSVVCVKANQRRLYRWIEQQWQNSPPESVYQDHERSHGRMVQWRVSVFESLGEFAAQWPGVRRGIGVERQGLRAGQVFYERQYYISSVATTAQQFHAIIRGHWCIENRLHWVKDVTFNGRQLAATGALCCCQLVSRAPLLHHHCSLFRLYLDRHCQAKAGKSVGHNFPSPTMKQPWV